MKTGDAVRISGPPGVVTGEVVDIRSITELPEVADAGPVEQVRTILAEAGVCTIAVLAYRYDSGRRVAFVALGNGKTWKDFRGQELEITVIEKRTI